MNHLINIEDFISESGKVMFGTNKQELNYLLDQAEQFIGTEEFDDMSAASWNICDPVIDRLREIDDPEAHQLADQISIWNSKNVKS